MLNAPPGTTTGGIFELKTVALKVLVPDRGKTEKRMGEAGGVNPDIVKSACEVDGLLRVPSMWIVISERAVRPKPVAVKLATFPKQVANTLGAEQVTVVPVMEKLANEVAGEFENELLIVSAKGVPGEAVAEKEVIVAAEAVIVPRSVTHNAAVSRNIFPPLAGISIFTVRRNRVYIVLSRGEAAQASIEVNSYPPLKNQYTQYFQRQQFCWKAAKN